MQKAVKVHGIEVKYVDDEDMYPYGLYLVSVKLRKLKGRIGVEVKPPLTVIDGYRTEFRVAIREDRTGLKPGDHNRPVHLPIAAVELHKGNSMEAELCKLVDKTLDQTQGRRLFGWLRRAA